MIGDSHLHRINKSRFKNDNVGNAVYFKCFSVLNTKQPKYYANPTLAYGQLNTVIFHVGSNDINTFHHNKIDVEDLAPKTILKKLGKNASHMASIKLRYCQFW